MDLHRPDAKGEWEYIPESERTAIQSVAAKTNGLLTPANVITVAGTALVLDGLRDVHNDNYVSGTVKIGVGRVCDYVDGWVSARQGTLGPVGEALDAGVDKLQMAAALGVLTKKAVIPPLAAGVMGVQNALNAGITLSAKAKNREIHTTAEGKLATAGQWLAIGSYVVAATARSYGHESVAQKFRVTGNVLTAMSTIGFGAKATFDYYQDLQTQPVLES